jgi:hypothetical protein
MTVLYHEFEVLETYRGVPVYAGQPPERVEQAKRDIDAVYRLRSPTSLYEFACDRSHGPESRWLARNKCLASMEARQRKPVNVDRLIACTCSLSPRASRLGRLMAARDYDGWPEAWIPGDPPKPTPSQLEEASRQVAKPH